MPIFMDRHDVSEEVTAEHVALLHQADLKIQHKYNCKGLTYWFDGERQTAFCLVEAPDKKSLRRMHDNAHGEIPNRIIEVEESVVESFLGRIEDPKKSRRTALNIINDPAFRTLCKAEIKPLSLKSFGTDASNARIREFNLSIPEIISNFNGCLVIHKLHSFLASFDSVSKAVLCALEVQTRFKNLIMTWNTDLSLKIGLSAGVPVTEKEGLFEDAIRMAERLCHAGRNQISLSSEVGDLYKSEYFSVTRDEDSVHFFTPGDEHFLNLLLDHTEKEWTNTSMNAENLCKSLGFSKSQLYRKTTSVTGKSPNRFIKDYRLEKALKLLNRKKDNINQVAFDTGFNSPAYFSKCFHETFGVLPSTYTKQMI